MVVGDLESWFREWKDLACHVEALGTKAEGLGLGHETSAMQSYLRASNYYRMADFYLDRDDPREHPTYVKHVSLFQKASALHHPRVENISIPFEGRSLHGYFVRAVDKSSEATERNPCIIIFGGADATCEEAYFSSAVDASMRGFHSILIDGPGQGYTLRFEALYARFDYETAVEAAMDFLANNKSELVDLARIGVMGRSMGGYYSARSAARVQRLKAAVVFDAVFDISSDVYDFFPPVRRAINWDLGARTEEDARKRLAKFNLTGVAEQIRCPILIVHGEDDYVTSPEGAKKLYAAIKHEDKVLQWYKAGHGVSSFRAEATAYVFDWFREKL
jgi:dipeptidyl aminopeptidase/acylaminoacyl peptidase